MAKRPGPVLILAEQPLLAAMVGMLVELAGGEPRFANPDEQPADALARVRPLAVVLIDVRLDAARSDLLFALAARRRVGVALYGPADCRGEVASLARARRLPWFTATTDVEHLTLVLRAAAEQAWWRRGAERRRRTELQRNHDGSVVFADSNGMRWTVSDRRTGDDRREPGVAAEQISLTAVERIFISESGERLTYTPAAPEVLELSADALEEQLSRALPA